MSAKAAVGIFGAVVSVLGSGCAFEVDVGHENPNTQLVAVVPGTIRHELDLLFIIDDTDGMGTIQDGLGELWGRIRRHLEYAEGGFPEVRVGMITSDVGVGAALVPGCTATGDGAMLLPDGDGYPFRDLDALALDDADLAIADRFRAIGEGGCPFEQPLGAMQRALAADGPLDQAGFLRENAALGIVFVAGADDCSVADPAFFADGDAPLDKFRCFRAGIRCGEDDVAAGPQYGCEPYNDPLVADIGSHTKMLLEMKDDPRAIAVGAVLGDPEEVRILEDGGDFSLSPACTDAPSGAGELFPGVRLGAFALHDNLKGSVADLCSSTLADAGTPTALDLRRALGHRCLEGRVADVEPDEPGMQTECSVEATTGVAAPVDLPACPNPNLPYASPGPCFAIKAGPAACGDFPTQLALQVNWGGDDPMTAPPDTLTRVRCVVEDGGGPLDEPTNGLPD